MSGCAQISPLVGGDKDIYAPTIDSTKTYPINRVLNFSENKIIIQFNEYVKLNNVNDNIIITPKLSEKPTFYAKNKTFSLTFNENLQENTTYVINFNGAIQDITEKNDSIFQYVFSTGDYIDSLSISGHIQDSYTNRPISKCLIAIYPATTEIDFDSIPYLLKPTYIGQTDKLGNYKVDYLKDGEYVVLAFTDNNKNLLFDRDNEKIGFLNSKSILINENKSNLDFRLFLVEPEKTLMKTSNFEYPGKFQVTFNKEPDSFNLKSNVEFVQQTTQKKDSLIFWVTQKPENKISFYHSINGSDFDTLTPYFKDNSKKGDLQKLILKTNLEGGKLLPNDNFTISVNEPILHINESKFHFYDTDSNEVEINYQMDKINEATFYTFGSTVSYLQIDSLAIESFYGVFNHTKPKFNIVNRIADQYYGLLILNKNDSIKGNVIFELVDGKANVIRTITSPSSETKLEFKNLPPGQYELRAIKDKNKDKKWTTGSMKNLNQAEKVYYYTDKIKIRSKWDLEIEWVITD